jgi:hypothetical protein
LNMAVGDSHFKATVARGAQGNKIADNVGIILVDIVAARVNMMHVKSATAWATFCATTLANLVPVINHLTDIFPIAAMLQTCTAAPVGTMLAGHVLDSTLARAILPPLLFLGRKNAKGFIAAGASKCNVRTDSAGIGALGGAVSNLWASLVKEFSAKLTGNMGHLFFSPILVTFLRAKDMLDAPARPARLAAEYFSAVATRKRFSLADGVNRAFPRTMPNGRLIGFELLTTLEAYLDHS